MQESASSPWALVLAAGEGSRLRTLTRSASGASVPKQFCSLRAGPSLLHEALQRAREVTVRSRICTVVAQTHRYWWEPLLAHLPGENVIVQPQNRGTGHGILLPLLHILERDAEARVIIFPSDHHVRREPVLTRALRAMAERLQAGGPEILLLGLQPEETDPELGYIVPGVEDGNGGWQVQRFVEKPTASIAHELIARGALWNAFILAAPVASLLELLGRRLQSTVDRMRSAVRADRAGGPSARAVEALYGGLPEVDFSREVLSGQEAHLRVLAVPQCGWSDLGTPRRVGDALRQLVEAEADLPAPMGRGYLNLAMQFQAMQSMSLSGSSR